MRDTWIRCALIKHTILNIEKYRLYCTAPPLTLIQHSCSKASNQHRRSWQPWRRATTRAKATTPAAARADAPSCSARQPQHDIADRVVPGQGGAGEGDAGKVGAGEDGADERGAGEGDADERGAGERGAVERGAVERGVVERHSPASAARHVSEAGRRTRAVLRWASIRASCARLERVRRKHLDALT